VQQPNSGPRQLIVEVSRSHTIRYTHPVGLLWTSYQPVAEAATYTAHNRHKRRTSCFSRIRAQHPSNQAASDPCLRAHGYRHRPL